MCPTWQVAQQRWQQGWQQRQSAPQQRQLQRWPARLPAGESAGPARPCAHPRWLGPGMRHSTGPLPAALTGSALPAPTQQQDVVCRIKVLMHFDCHDITNAI